MKLQIVRIVDRGIANKERIQLTVLADTNLNYYVVFDTAYNTPNSISRFPKHVFWFPSLAVKAGDQVVLYTGFGQQKSEPALGRTNHLFYWEQKNTLFNKTGDCAVLLEITSWQTSPYE